MNPGGYDPGVMVHISAAAYLTPAQESDFAKTNPRPPGVKKASVHIPSNYKYSSTL